MFNRRDFLKIGTASVALGSTSGIFAKTTTPTLGKLPALSESKKLLLNFNENSLGMSLSAKRAILENLDLSNYYPDNQRAQLIDAIAKYHGVDSNQVSLGNGSSENIQAYVQAIYTQALKAGKKFQLIVPDPTFNYAETYANAIGATVVKVPLNQHDFSFDVTTMQAKAQNFDGITLFYLCNPNNPTATITPKNILFSWIRQAPTHHYFLLDEAYAEYASDKAFASGLELIKEGNHQVLVTRTFSKLYGLAGLRIGYAIGTPSAIESTESMMSFDNTNLAGAVAALASLHDESFYHKSLASNAHSRQIIQDALDELKLRYLPSNGNFIFHQIKGDVKTYQERMKSHHVLVGREFLPITGWNRLTLGTPEEMTVFVKILKEFRQKGWV